MGKGCIANFRNQYFKLTPEKQNKLYQFNIIHPNFYLKTKLLLRGFFDSKTLMDKVHVYDSLATFINNVQRDVNT